MKKLLTMVVLLGMILLAGCSSGKKSYQQGDYGEAVFQSTKRLRQSPNNKKALETIANAYPQMVRYNLDRVNNLKRSGKVARWEDIMSLYDELNRAYDEIQRSPAALRLVPEARSYISEFELARLKAAEARYAIAEKEMVIAVSGDREAAKRAYDSFEIADDLQPGFRDARLRMEMALDLATVYVKIEPIPMHSRALELSNEFFQNKIIEYARSANINTFVRFLTEKEFKSFNKQPDQNIQMIFDDFVVGQAFVKETVEQRVRDSVVVGTVDVTEGGEKVTKDVYETVKVEVHIFEKKLESSGLLDFRIVDSNNGAVITQQKFPGTHIWIDYWGFFNGDERALTKEDKNRLRKKREVMPPPPQDLFVAFTEPIYGQITRFVRDYYRGY